MDPHNRPRVALVAASLDILGGQGIQAQSLADLLASDGYRVDFIPINPRFPWGLGWLRKVPYLRTIVNQLFFIPSLATAITADVVHVFSASYMSFLLAPVPALVLGRLLNKRVVLHYHSGEADDHLTNWGKLVHPWLKLADLIVVPSEYLAGVFATHGYQTKVIHNVIDLSRFAYHERQPLGAHLLSTRNLEPYYRVDTIIEAFTMVRALRPDATLTVAGYGSEEAGLRRLAGEGVTFVGRVAPETMPELCASADIFLNASVVDNQPVSILEAFASGLPVISSPTGDIPAMVRHEHTGLIVQPNDPASLASAVLYLLDHPREALEMARHAREAVIRYTWTAVKGQWAAAYSGVHNSMQADSRVLPRESQS
jgi:glycosyltransferase involved in cell wall biosynthesis